MFSSLINDSSTIIVPSEVPKVSVPALANVLSFASLSGLNWGLNCCRPISGVSGTSGKGATIPSDGVIPKRRPFDVIPVCRPFDVILVRSPLLVTCKELDLRKELIDVDDDDDEDGNGIDARRCEKSINSVDAGRETGLFLTRPVKRLKNLNCAFTIIALNRNKAKSQNNAFENNIVYQSRT